MNKPIIFKLLSIVMIPIACGMGISVIAGLLIGESARDAAILALIGGCTASLGFAALFHFLGRQAQNRIFRREALCAIGVGWIMACFLGAIPFFWGLPGCTFSDALFESASGISTTGASVFGNLDEFPASLLFWRAISQWIGGLGVVVFFVALLASLGVGAKILFSNESTGTASDMDQGRIQSGAFRIMVLYLGLSALCVLAYRMAGMGWFDAFCHSFTTVATGGFSTHPGSIGGFQSAAIEWVSILFMTLGGITFVFMLRILRGNRTEAVRNTEVHWYLGLIVMGTVAITLLLINQNGAFAWHDTIRTAAFQVVSLTTTTGYATADYTLWFSGAQLILICLMFIGGTSGSTSGGAKVIRVVVVSKAALRSVLDAFRPNVIRPIWINGKVLSESAVASVTTYLVLLLVITLVSAVIVAFLEPNLDILTVGSTVQATFFNIGPGFGGVGPTETFASLSAPTKCFLSFLMILGRLELYAVLVLLAPTFWRRYS